MAIIKETRTDVWGDGSSILLVWTPLTEADTCRAVALPAHSDKSVHASGTFGGASVSVQGSNNSGASFVALNDAATGTPVAITAEAIKAVLENTQQIKPVAAGGAAQILTISMLVHLANPLRQ